MRKSQFIFVLMLSTALGLANVYAGGSCAPDGDTTSTCHWEIENRVLTISGSGAMVNYSSPSMYPWYSQKDSYTSVVVEGANETTGTTGVTSIAKVAFRGNNLTSVVIPDSVTSIGLGAFYSNNLTSVVIPDSVTSIGRMAFWGSQATDLVCSAENLQRYLGAAGAFVNSGDINLSCTTGICKFGRH